jgi:hypothetical protein
MLVDQQLSIRIQNKPFGDALEWWKLFKELSIACAKFAIIHVDDDKVLIQQSLERSILLQRAINGNTPFTPVASYINNDVLAFQFALLLCIGEILFWMTVLIEGPLRRDSGDRGEETRTRTANFTGPPKC